MNRRPLVLAGLLGAALLAGASPVAAHPLGNSTVNRGVAVTILSSETRITYVVDMAEIPAYAAILDMDLDSDGKPSAAERAGWAWAHCEAARTTLTAVVDERPISLASASPPSLSFPPGVGGLETLRLVCSFAGDTAGGSGIHAISVADGGGEERPGWREVTITAGEGIRLETSDVPLASPSGLLTAYPEHLLEAPLNVTSGSATYRSTGRAAGTTDRDAGADVAGGAGIADPRDALVDLLGSPSTPLAWFLALSLAAGLGAAHAASPGHGKALVAAYGIGSSGSLRRAAGLGLTVALSHTLGVFVLGASVLAAAELLVPERVVTWLSVVSGALVVILGVSLARRAWRAPARSARHAVHAPPHGHAHPHADPAAHSRPHPRPVAAPPPPSMREFITLGLVGGMVPSTSALLVLLVAVSTGKVAEGLVLIGAFGTGMAVVLGGLAAVASTAGKRLAVAAVGAENRTARRLAGAAPLISAAVVIAVGVVTAISAVGSL